MKYKGPMPTLEELYIEAFEDGKEIPRVFDERKFNELDDTRKTAWEQSKEYTDRLWRLK